ncbi:MAG: HdeD family acid-resistance protein [Actinomycetota bacterium]
MQISVYEELKNYWWLFLVSGVLSVGIGAALLFWPDKTLGVVGWLIGFWMLFFGIIRFLIALFGGKADGRWVLLFISLIGIALGIVVMKNPAETIGVIVIIAAIFWIISGLVDVFRGIQDGDLPGRGWVIFGGALAIIAGVIVVLWPEASILVLAIIAGIYFLMDGALQIVAAFKIKAA